MICAVYKPGRVYNATLFARRQSRYPQRYLFDTAAATPP